MGQIRSYRVKRLGKPFDARKLFRKKTAVTNSDVIEPSATPAHSRVLPRKEGCVAGCYKKHFDNDLISVVTTTIDVC